MNKIRTQQESQSKIGSSFLINEEIMTKRCTVTHAHTAFAEMAVLTGDYTCI